METEVQKSLDKASRDAEEIKKGLSSSTEEQTVIFFAGDVIKRLDLIDNLIQRYDREPASTGVAQQLRTLRASFEDALAQHGVSEFSVRPDTEVDIALRQRINVVENLGGTGKTRVLESYRPGFLYAPGDGREIILRKVEVKTSSE